MKHHLLAAAASLSLTGAALPALAQTTGSLGPSVIDELALGPQDEVVVREYIVRRGPRPIAVGPERLSVETGPVVTREPVPPDPTGPVRLRPGSLVPAYVDLEPMMDVRDAKLRNLAYFISPDDKIVVVDPRTRTVARIMDR